MCCLSMTLKLKEMNQMNKMLYNIRSELNDIQSRNVTFEKCIKARLSNSIAQHKKDVNRICKYLKMRNSLKVLTQINKFNKKKMRKKNDSTK